VNPDLFAWVRTLARNQAGLVLDVSKDYLLTSRLNPLAKAAGAPDLATWLADARTGGSPAAATAIVEALLTNETSFLRDAAPYKVLAETLLPELTAAGVRHPRIWSAACSTGQEPYSIAMVIADHASRNPGTSGSVHATDLDSHALAVARAGVYSTSETNRGLPAPLLVRHFVRDGASWKVGPAIRRMVTFAPLNLIQPFPVSLGTFDLVFIRNVLIYFDAATKRAILARVRQQLRPGGYLVLGAAETTLGLDDTFVLRTIGRTTVYQTPGA
jgi:chemotaxis protein methyltransferase CheR